MKEEDLVKAIMDGGPACERALELVYEKYKRKAMNTLKSRGANMDDAKDAVQEGMLALWINVSQGKYQGRGSLGAYFTSICMNVFFNVLRRDRSRKAASSLEAPSEQGVELDPLLIFLKKEQRRRFDEFIKLLKPTCIKLYDLLANGMSGRAIAERMPLASANSVYTKTNDCRKQFKDILRNSPEWRKFFRELI